MKTFRKGRSQQFDSAVAVADDGGADFVSVGIATTPKKVAVRWRLISDLKAIAVKSIVRILERVGLPRYANIFHDMLFLSFFWQRSVIFVGQVKGTKCIWSNLRVFLRHTAGPTLRH